MKYVHTFESFVNESKDVNEGAYYAVMLIGGSIGDKPRPRDAKGYAGMDVDKDEWLTDLNNAKAKAKRMNTNLSPGEKSHYGLKYIVVPVKDGKFIKESLNEGKKEKFLLYTNPGNSTDRAYVVIGAADVREVLSDSKRYRDSYQILFQGSGTQDDLIKAKNMFSNYRFGDESIDESIDEYEEVSEGDMTNQYDGFIVIDFKTKKLYRGHYIKGVKNTIAEDMAIDKAMKLTGSPRYNFAIHGFIKKGKWDESDTEVLEAIDTKYWADYNKDTSGQGNKEHEVKTKDFEEAFEDAVVYWNQEADGAENRIKGAQIQKIKKLAQEFFKKEGYISVNIVTAMITQES